MNENDIQRHLKIATATVILASLFILWPNFVHEPIHWLALKSTGGDGYINFKFNYPATPSTTRTSGDFSGIGQGLWFLLAPSLFSIIIYIWCYWTIERPGIITHIALPIYLGIDLISNIIGYKRPISDFRFFVIWPWAAYVLAAIVGIACFIIVHKSIHNGGKQL